MRIDLSRFGGNQALSGHVDVGHDGRNLEAQFRSANATTRKRVRRTGALRMGSPFHDHT